MYVRGRAIYFATVPFPPLPLFSSSPRRLCWIYCLGQTVVVVVALPPSCVLVDLAILRWEFHSRASLHPTSFHYPVQVLPRSFNRQASFSLS